MFPFHRNQTEAMNLNTCTFMFVHIDLTQMYLHLLSRYLTRDLRYYEFQMTRATSKDGATIVAFHPKARELDATPSIATEAMETQSVTVTLISQRGNARDE